MKTEPVNIRPTFRNFIAQPFVGLFLALAISSVTAATKSEAQITQPDVLLLVSERNAETVAAAVDRYHSTHPNKKHCIQARSSEQLLAMQPAQMTALLSNSKQIVAAGLFGPVVDQLEAVMKRSNPKSPSTFIFNSDHRLVALSHQHGKYFFQQPALLKTLSATKYTDNFQGELTDLLKRHPAQKEWIQAQAFWKAGGSDNVYRLLNWVLNDAKQQVKPRARLRWFNLNKQDVLQEAAKPIQRKDRSTVVILDHAGGDRPADRHVLQTICNTLLAQKLHCVVALAYWGEAGVEALTTLRAQQDQLSAIIMLQDFVVGGGEGREAATAQFKSLNVPVLKAIKSRDRSEQERRLSPDGLSSEKVYYQIAMPELQGASQPLVVASAGKTIDHSASGIRIRPIAVVKSIVGKLVSRISGWQDLHRLKNADKKIAVIYYNHPPGRHNIGADNLDVPATLWELLNRLKAQGYNTGSLPTSQDALLDLLQEKGVNLPNNYDELEAMAPKITNVDTTTYTKYFKSLPTSIQKEMEFGPFGYLHEQLQAATTAKLIGQAAETLKHTHQEMLHLLEGVDHPARARALALLAQLEKNYQACFVKATSACWQQSFKIVQALQGTGIEGLSGWGKAPGKVMVHKNELLLPGLQFGNVFLGPQPPRGWEINEELLHANLAFPPPHQYLAFYHYLKDTFKADALVHIGRHSTYEFLPRRSVGLLEDDYSMIIAGNIPSIYPYIVDGVGEGIQAKRRGLAVMVDHLTPPLEHTPLYDDLLQLRQLIESFEANHDTDNSALRARLVKQIREKVDMLELRDELAESMSAELTVMGISFEEVDDDMMVHEVGHYLTNLQERFMPLGLHIFGKDWDDKALNMMLTSMDPETKTQKQQWRTALKVSPSREMASLFNALEGGFVEPGKGNDPIRSPQSIPTGRNFFALDSSLIPSATAWQLGSEMAVDARKNNAQNPDKSEALILWASDVVRDEGVMIAFGLNMLGVEPHWNSRGLLKGLKLQKLDGNRVRRNIIFTTSGLFRDLYAQQMLLLDEAVLLAVSASGNIIVKDYPALTLSLQSALSPLENVVMGSESLAQNQVAAHWLKQARALLAKGVTDKDAGQLATLRVFGDAQGTYGAGVNRLAERSGAWEKRDELAKVYLRRLGHSYGSGKFGAPSQDMFKAVLSDVENTYFGRSSNLYGLIDNNDAFDYLGGLSLAVETLTDIAPNSYVINHADSKGVVTQPLKVALRQELRGRFLNPEWLKGLMNHGYAGARTMGSEFLEYLWGWQVTNPTLVGDWAWEEVNAVYMQDRYELGLDEFLEEGHNAHVKSNMLAIMLVAIHKGFWKADLQTTKALAEDFATLVKAKGLPGSGHTDPDHPMLPWLKNHLSSKQWQELAAIIEQAKAPEKQAENVQALHTVAELQEVSDNLSDETQQNVQENNQRNPPMPWLPYMAGLLLFGIFILGFWRNKTQHV